jgi:DNA primase
MQEKKHRTFNHFNKGDHLYGFWKLPSHMDFLIVVEGEMDLLKARQFGCQNVVSLSGCNMSKTQRDILVNLNIPILLALDGDKAGRDAVRDISRALMPTVTVFEITEWGEYKDFGSVSSLSEFQKIIANKSLTLETAYAMIRNIK